MQSEAFDFCLERIKAREIPMKLVRVEFLFDRSKAIFYFTSEKRVDFRELVKDLASKYHRRDGELWPGTLLLPFSQHL
jgi:cell fate regulator YaaT (PSP1 superfamily)